MPETSTSDSTKHPTADAPVVFEQRQASQGRSLGIVTLNAEKTLHSLSLEMVQLLLQQFIQWANDDRIVAVFITSTGDKAFCAGGDIQQIYRSAVDDAGGPCDYAEAFFQYEYRLDYLLHTYPKPVICWGHGIVMGGGLGIMAGCSHRVVTEKTRIGMPEVTIALYPDVGASWFLNRMPGKSGLFIALTAASLNAADALYLGLADVYLAHENKQDVITALLNLEWQTDKDKNNKLVSECLQQLSPNNKAPLPTGNIESCQAIIDEACQQSTVAAIVESILALDSHSPWLDKAKAALAEGSPIAIKTIALQLEKSAVLNLADIFRFELMLSTNVVRYPEFSEGVRALIIDKDRNPKWRYNRIDDVPDSLMEQFFTPPWETNPLADL